MRSEKLDISMEPLRRIARSPDRSYFSELDPPLIMGILNVTPDSFSDGGEYNGLDLAVERGLQMAREGADIIDIGGESTRPFAETVPIEDELGRTIPVVEALAGRVKIPISIDTRHVEVANKALSCGASIVNDVNGLRGEGMEELAVSSGATVVVMHMKGDPGNMQLRPHYDDVVDEVHHFLRQRVEHLTALGVDKGRIWIDPGIGFGKRVWDNLLIIRELSRFDDIGCPILLGPSRKSFIGRVLEQEVEDRSDGSLASALIGVQNGTSIIRVHDVASTRDALMMQKAINSPDDHRDL